MAGILVEIFRHNTWANLRLLDVCAALNDEQLDSAASGTYGSVRDTLVHILAAEGRYIARLTGRRPENPLQEGTFPGIEELRDRARRSGEQLEALASRTRVDRKLRTPFQDKEYSIMASVVLVQAINHATEHRAQVATVLSQHGIQPPTLDGWTYGEASGQIRPLQ